MGVVRIEGKTNANATFGHGTLECLVTDESYAEWDYSESIDMDNVDRD